MASVRAHRRFSPSMHAPAAVGRHGVFASSTITFLLLRRISSRSGLFRRSERKILLSVVADGT